MKINRCIFVFQLHSFEIQRKRRIDFWSQYRFKHLGRDEVLWQFSWLRTLQHWQGLGQKRIEAMSMIKFSFYVLGFL